MADSERIRRETTQIRTRLGRSTAALIGIALSMSSLAASSGPETSPAREFMAAMQRVHQAGTELPDSHALQTYVLYDYLVAARLRRELQVHASPALDTSVDQFLQTRGNEPVARPLRREWLASLAHRERWDWFLARSADPVDPALACDRLSGRLATADTTGLAQEALERWNLLQKQPDECAPVFAWLRTQGAITPDIAEARTRAALSADNPRAARESVGDVPAPRSALLLQSILLLEAPQPTLAVLSLSAAKPADPDALALSFNHLAFSNFNAASSLLPALLERADMNPSLKARLLRSAALGAAYSRSDKAVSAFAELPPDVNDTQVFEWRVRAALWAADFTRVAAWIEAMPTSLASQPRWRYWYARAVAATVSAEAAAPLFAEIAGMRDYYGYLAADRLDKTYDLNIHVSPDDAAAQSALAAVPAMVRAHALFDCEMTDEAGVEWAQELAGAKPSVKVQAAHLASRWGWYAQTIATLAQAGEWDDVPLRYPRPYAGIVADISKESGVSIDWIYAVMRQESLFRKDAVSRADARGLMQMQPPTASAVARHWHLAAPNRDELFDPPQALRLGALYLRELLDKYDGQLEQCLAAYNAGPAALARWQPTSQTDADIWIENIPYTETRGYVQHIMEHIVAFAVMRGTTPPRLSSLLPLIRPATSAPGGSSQVE